MGQQAGKGVGEKRKGKRSKGSRRQQSGGGGNRTTSMGARMILRIVGVVALEGGDSKAVERRRQYGAWQLTVRGGISCMGDFGNLKERGMDRWGGNGFSFVAGGQSRQGSAIRASEFLRFGGIGRC